MQFTGSEQKRSLNIKVHGLDFIDAPRAFESLRYTFEDARFDPGEQRFETLGRLAGLPVSVVHTETEDENRITSFRKATKREAKIYDDQVRN